MTSISVGVPAPALSLMTSVAQTIAATAISRGGARGGLNERFGFMSVFPFGRADCPLDDEPVGMDTSTLGNVPTPAGSSPTADRSSAKSPDLVDGRRVNDLRRPFARRPPCVAARAAGHAALSADGVTSITQLPSSTANSSVSPTPVPSAGARRFEHGLLEQLGQLGVDVDPSQKTLAAGDEIGRHPLSRRSPRPTPSSEPGPMETSRRRRWSQPSSSRCVVVSNTRHDPASAVPDTWISVTVIPPISSPAGSSRRRWSRQRWRLGPSEPRGRSRAAAISSYDSGGSASISVSSCRQSSPKPGKCAAQRLRLLGGDQPGGGRRRVGRPRSHPSATGTVRRRVTSRRASLRTIMHSHGPTDEVSRSWSDRSRNRSHAVCTRSSAVA